MKLHVATLSAVVLAGTKHAVAINYQPNGVTAFTPVSVLMSAPTPNPNVYRGADKDYDDMIGVIKHNIPKTENFSVSGQTTRVTDPSSALLAQLLTPLKTVLTRMLEGIESRLENANPDNLAGMLRGPISELKQYLISIWPTSSL
ncbi:hypothetical protein COEREDRAFT_86052 [Coemansia reversa NRRL 1564]|uniref:Uncharacterized protein n=1 Tax=Coemansia reversa (strain ATCC 12441 / NRRL 1564) TaxID=763665 RepID=A0A2G5BEJ7_COERN|nr:hypothetical protein COEREDRAFT_86052 [Coemansia reversa NRRL 1564]|eukprot:PIA17421.1 hypothetical protein COEREDRAFT_86052 [Coemansia reversa NRRL 1564]